LQSTGKIGRRSGRSHEKSSSLRQVRTIPFPHSRVSVLPSFPDPRFPPTPPTSPPNLTIASGIWGEGGRVGGKSWIGNGGEDSGMRVRGRAGGCGVPRPRLVPTLGGGEIDDRYHKPLSSIRRVFLSNRSCLLVVICSS
jgi:hypothetical protein